MKPVNVGLTLGSILDLLCGEKWGNVVILIRRRTAAERIAEV